MAANGDSGMDQQAHVRTYGKFLGMLKWSTIATVVITAAVVLLIAS